VSNKSQNDKNHLSLKRIALDFIIVLVIAIIIAVASTSLIFVLVNVDALKSLIEAESTVFGFFGLVAVYLLTSLDNRLDGLEKERHEFEMHKLNSELQKNTPNWDPFEIGLTINRMNKEVKDRDDKIDKIVQKKKFAVSQLTVTGLFFLISLISSIVLLGFQSQYAQAINNLNSPYTPLAGIAGPIPPLFFFMGIWYFLKLFRQSNSM
jgi:hypothetical protein